MHWLVYYVAQWYFGDNPRRLLFLVSTYLLFSHPYLGICQQLRWVVGDEIFWGTWGGADGKTSINAPQTHVTRLKMSHE